MAFTPLSVGQLFPQFSDLKDVIQDWAIVGRFEFRLQCKDKSRADYQCKTNNNKERVGKKCGWRVYAARTKNGDIQIGKLISEHTCLGHAPTPRPTCNHQSWLRRHIPEHLIVTRQTTAREIQQTMQLHHNVQVNYQAAHEAYSVLANDNIQYERDSYRQLPAYLERLNNQNPDTYTNLELQNDLNVDGNIIKRFWRIFISPAPARHSFQYCRKLIAVDGTFCKAQFTQVLLLAVTIDANGHVVLLAWAIVEGENTESWSYFMTHLKVAIPEIIVKCTIISDREKELLVATDILGPHITRAHCTFHLRENFKKFGKGITDQYFSKIANAQTKEAYDHYMLLLQVEKPAAAEYLRGIDKTLWVTAFFPGDRYGHTTSNIVESFNKTFKLAREMPILDMLNTIWHSHMKLRFERLQQASNQSHGYFTPLCKTVAQTSSIWAPSKIVRMANRKLGEVKQQNDVESGRDRVFLVNCKFFSHYDED